MRSLWPFKVPWSLWLHCEGKSLPVSHTFILLPAFSPSFCWCQAHSASCWVCQVCVRSEMLNHYLLFRDLPCVCRAARTSLGLCTTFAVVKYCTPTWKHKTTVNVFMHRHTQTHQYFLFFKYFESMISLQLCFTPWQQMWKADFQQVNLWVDRCCETLGEYNAVFTHAMHRRLVLVWLDVLIRTWKVFCPWQLFSIHMISKL